MNFWNQKPYTLFPANKPGNYAKVFKQQATNSFWLEPAVYFGPPIQVDQIDVSAGALCYRVQFANGDMSDVWRGLYFFPAGHLPLPIPGPGSDPQPVLDTERVQANTTVNGAPMVISLYVDTAAPPPGGFRVQVVDTGGPGGGGWGGGHN